MHAAALGRQADPLRGGLHVHHDPRALGTGHHGGVGRVGHIYRLQVVAAGRRAGQVSPITHDVDGVGRAVGRRVEVAHFDRVGRGAHIDQTQAARAIGHVGDAIGDEDAAGVAGCVVGPHLLGAGRVADVHHSQPAVAARPGAAGHDHVSIAADDKHVVDVGGLGAAGPGIEAHRRGVGRVGHVDDFHAAGVLGHVSQRPRHDQPVRAPIGQVTTAQRHGHGWVGQVEGPELAHFDDVAEGTLSPGPSPSEGEGIGCVAYGHILELAGPLVSAQDGRAGRVAHVQDAQSVFPAAQVSVALGDGHPGSSPVVVVGGQPGRMDRIAHV